MGALSLGKIQPPLPCDAPEQISPRSINVVRTPRSANEYAVHTPTTPPPTTSTSQLCVKRLSPKARIYNAITDRSIACALRSRHASARELVAAAVRVETRQSIRCCAGETEAVHTSDEPAAAGGSAFTRPGGEVQLR
jgi:hypothetical protein